MSARVPGGVWVVPTQTPPMRRPDGDYEYQLSDGTTVLLHYVPAFAGGRWAWLASTEDGTDGYHGCGETEHAAMADLIEQMAPKP